jgi:hypothetical protein
VLLEGGSVSAIEEEGGDGAWVRSSSVEQMRGAILPDLPITTTVFFFFPKLLVVVAVVLGSTQPDEEGEEEDTSRKKRNT